MYRLIDQVRDEIRHTDEPIDTAKVITNALARAGFDLRREPSLEDVKRILVAVSRADAECRCVA